MYHQGKLFDVLFFPLIVAELFDSGQFVMGFRLDLDCGCLDCSDDGFVTNIRTKAVLSGIQFCRLLRRILLSIHDRSIRNSICRLVGSYIIHILRCCVGFVVLVGAGLVVVVGGGFTTT